MTIPARFYKSHNKLRKWDTLASVRAKPRRLIAEEDQANIYFPPELIPVVQHPVIQNLGPQVVRQILIHRLYQYLDFTIVLEQEAVNPSLLNIAYRRLGVELPDLMEFDAHKIYVDEGYHGLFCEDLKRQVIAETGVARIPVGTPHFLRRLREIETEVPCELRVLTSLFFTIVSETLISALLYQIPRDQRVVGAVRETIHDHAQDEANHHYYFATLLRFLWPQLTAGQKSIIGPLLPHFILSFLEPDYSAINDVLAQYDLEPKVIQRVIDESYPKTAVLSGIREGARATLNHFNQNGAFAEPRTRKAFQENGLIKPEPENDLKPLREICA